MYGKMQQHLQQELEAIKEAGLYKTERLIEGPHQAAINVNGKEVRNFCANNYGTLQPSSLGAGREGYDGPSRLRHVFRAFHLRNTRCAQRA